MRILFSLLLLLNLGARLSAQGAGFSDCDPLSPGYCMAPFPNDFYMQPSNSTPTGKIIRLNAEMLPVSNEGQKINPADWLRADGFARVLPASCHFLGVDLEASKLPRHWDIELSLIQNAPSFLVDTETGEAQPHWTELDLSTPTAPANQQFLMLWPTQPLQFARRYIVAYRNLRDAQGALLQPSEAFLSLRDRIPSEDYDVEGRRQHYEENIFPLLTRLGIPREELQLAWDYTIASEKGTRSPLQHAVQDALSRIGSEGPRYRILSVQDDITEFTGRYILGQFRVPSYLEADRPGSKLVLGEDGLPVFQRYAWYPFSLSIPISLTTGKREPNGILQYGHGLFQNHATMIVPELQEASELGGLVLYAANMVGMSVRDVAAVADMLNTDLSDASILPNGCIQGVVNFLLLTKMVLGDIAEDERLIFNNVSMIVKDKNRGYFGYSLGGIYGPTVVSLSEDINEGIFGVPGSPFVMLLPRAQPFAPYWAIISSRYSNPMDRVAFLSYIQLLWDQVDSVGWVDLLASLPQKISQFVWAKGDSQVTYLGHNLLARGAGARVFSNYITSRENETFWGMEVLKETTVYGGHMSIGYDFGVPEVPIYNFPPEAATDTHNEVYKQRTFVDRSLALVLEKVHHQECQGQCGYDS